MPLPTRPEGSNPEQSAPQQPYAVVPTATPTPASAYAEPHYETEIEYDAPAPVSAPAVESFEEVEAEPMAPTLTDEDLADDYEDFSPEDVVAARNLLGLLNDTNSSEVLLNGPTSIMYKKDGARIHADNIKFSSVKAYHQFIDDLILEYTDTTDRIGAKGTENYLIEGQLTLPDFEDETRPDLLARVHILVPPVVSEAKVTIAKKNRFQLTVDDMVNSGAMSTNMGAFLIAVARGRATTVFSGLSGSGKTTLLEALSNYFDPNDRIVVVEDTPELRLASVTDVVYLHSTAVKPGSDPLKAITLEWLVSSTNRMRPDRIIVGEIRGGEMSEFLIAANSGADGSMTTLHASSPKLTLDKMISLALKSSTSKSETSVARDISSTVQIIIQMALIEGRHIITHIEEVTRVVRKETGGIVTQTLFAYDRDRNTFVPQQRPTAELTSFLAQRGVEIDNSWFRGV